MGLLEAFRVFSLRISGNVSRLPGFFLPLSGGADSSATCALVGVMCRLIVKSIEEDNECVLNDIRRIAGYGQVS